MSIVTRETRETRIRVEVNRGTGVAKVATTRPFLDHMLVTLAKYGALDLHVRAEGDLPHHVIEDVGITVGAAVAQLGAGARYGHRVVPMDDALVEVALDLGGRPYYRGPLPGSYFEHWMRSFADHAHATLHVRVLRGEDRHHVVEAAFKALGFTLRDALATGGDPFSTKGPVAIGGA
jgi:imidazoleglycerol-phosphate dehydratase